MKFFVNWFSGQVSDNIGKHFGVQHSPTLHCEQSYNKHLSPYRLHCRHHGIFQFSQYHKTGWMDVLSAKRGFLSFVTDF